MPAISLFLLGLPRIEVAGAAIALQRKKALALLSYLGVTGQAQSRDTLAVLFWPEHDQPEARAGLRRALSDLRQVLGETSLEAERESVRLVYSPNLCLDVTAFRERIAAWKAHHHSRDGCPECMASLTEATSWYRGDFLSGFNLTGCPEFDNWQSLEREKLRNELAGVLEWLSQAYAEAGNFETAIAYAKQWLELDTLDEAAHRQLMRLYAGMGKRTTALRQYAECERILKEELDVEPQEKTRLFYQMILENHEPPSSATLTPTPQPVTPQESYQQRNQHKEEIEHLGMSLVDRVHPTPPVIEDKPETRHNLPAQMTAFIGREKELVDLARLLSDPQVRLLTVLGPGGVGKTRLALETARQQLGSYPHGVFFVSLAALESIQSIIPAIADALGFQFYNGSQPLSQLLNYLEHKQMLLVLDNCEHVLEGVHVAADILKTALRVKLLATSRSPLNLEGEQRYQLGGMDFPAPISQEVKPLESALHFSSVQLFLQGVRRAISDYAPDTEGLEQIVRICRVLGGVPLAIRLASAWVELLTPQQIADEIEKSIDFLGTESRDIPERQRSMRATFEHSWKLLSEGERGVFAGLSVFRGGFTLEAAQAVTKTSLRRLMLLIDRSLIYRGVNERYTMHELLRQYAAEKLTEDPAVEQASRELHGDYFCAKLQQWEKELKGAGQVQALNKIDAEIENCRVAWDLAVEQGQVERLTMSLDSIYLFHLWRKRIAEGVSMLQKAVLDMPCVRGDGMGLMRMKALNRQILLIFEIGNLDAVSSLVNICVSLYQDTNWKPDEVSRSKAYMLQVQVMLYAYQGKINQSVKKMSDWVAALREIDDDWELSSGLYSEGMIHSINDHYELAIPLIEEGLLIFRKLGDPRGIGSSLSVLGSSLVLLGRTEEGEKTCQESVSLLRQIEDQYWMVGALRNLGIVQCYYLGKLTEGHETLEESITTGEKSENRYILAWSLGVQGYMKLALGDFIGGRRRLEDTLIQARRNQDVIMTGTSLCSLALCAVLENHPEEAKRFTSEAMEYRDRMMQEEAGLLSTIGLVYVSLGYLQEAGSFLFDAIQKNHNLHKDNPWNLMDAAPGIALLLSRKGHPEQALELYALAVKHFPYLARAKHINDLAWHHVRAAADSLSPEVAAAAQERGRHLDLQTTTRALLTELQEMENE